MKPSSPDTDPEAPSVSHEDPSEENDGQTHKSPIVLPPRKSASAYIPSLDPPWSNGGLLIETAPIASPQPPEKEMCWFHCGRCGTMFQAASDLAPDERDCTQCGLNPSTTLGDRLPTPFDQLAPDLPPAEDYTAPTGLMAVLSGHWLLKNQKVPVMLKLIGGWVFLIGLILLMVNLIWNDEETQAPTPVETSPHWAEDKALLQTEFPKCITSFSGFLDADSPEGRNQFVLSPISSAYRIARYYSLNPAPKLDTTNFELSERAVIHLPGKPAIATLWKTGDNQLVEAVFREENGEWRLDWDHFVRYGDFPWSLFIAGTGPSEGEFRLLARERLADARKETDMISIACYPPSFGHPEYTAPQSTEMVVPRKTPNGRLLDAAFKLQRSGKQVFDSPIPEHNPDGMIRLRVKIRRIENEENRTFIITDILACHWFSVDDPGIEPVTAEAN